MMVDLPLPVSPMISKCWSSARDGMRNISLALIDFDADAGALHGLVELLWRYQNRAFQPASILHFLAAANVLGDRKGKLQGEGNKSKEELHLEEIEERNIAIDPVRNPCVKHFVLVVTRGFAIEIVESMDAGIRRDRQRQWLAAKLRRRPWLNVRVKRGTARRFAV